MRIGLPLVTFLLATSASAQQSAPIPPPSASPDRSSLICRDRIQQVRRELGQPPLVRDASPADPLLIAAVDKRIGGCSVLVMRNDTRDIRPLPAPGEHRVMPAR